MTALAAFARARLEDALSGLLGDASDVDVLGDAQAGLMALHLLYGSSEPVTLDPTEIAEQLDPGEPTCICPPGLAERGGFRSGCPVHHISAVTS